MDTLYHPELDRQITVPESTAQVLRTRGWTDVDPGDPAADDPTDQGDETTDGDPGDPVDDDTDPDTDSLTED